MKIKYVLCDLDGTLLNNRSDVSDEDLSTIDQVRKAGVEFVVATGRSTSFCMEQLAKLGVLGDKKNIIVASTGTLVVDGELEPLYIQPLSEENLMLAIDYTLKYQVPTYFITIKKNYLLGDVLNEGIMHIFPNTVHVDKDELSQIIKEDHTFVKLMTFFDKPDVLKAIEKEYLENTGNSVEVSSTTDRAVEFNTIQDNDDKGLSTFAEIVGCDPAEILAMGDSFTDLGMIKKAGVGACPANAKPGVKEYADYVSPFDNCHSAVSDILKKFVLE